MDAIAQASGVSKATIYNHWADKEALLMEVMELIHGLDREQKISTPATSVATSPSSSPAGRPTNSTPAAPASCPP